MATCPDAQLPVNKVFEIEIFSNTTRVCLTRVTKACCGQKVSLFGVRAGSHAGCVRRTVPKVSLWSRFATILDTISL